MAEENKNNGKDISDNDPEIELMDSDPVESSSNEAEKQLSDLRKEKDDIYDRLLRKHADFENYRRRAEKEKRDFQQYALSEFVGELLPILDNFERALSHSEEHSGSEYRKGVELIYRQLKDVLEKKGLRAIETEGQLFDPNFHEAIAREVRNEIPENTILEELVKGYYLRDKLLRPAMVKVSFHSDDRDIVDSESQDGAEWETNES